jgi:beta-lactamase superfamily II metal-dependent hydrolase
MGYEIDYIAVGNGEKSGDAIAFRYGNLIGEGEKTQTVVVLDGGTKESAETLIRRIQNEYGTSVIVDILISTHPDMDHLSGLKEILKQFPVNTLYIHIPWQHIDEIKENFKEDFTIEELTEKLQNEFDLVNEIVGLALEKGVAVEEAFVGTPINNELTILGPTKEYYEELLCQSDKTPDTKSAFEQARDMIKKFEEKVKTWIEDSFDIEILDDNAEKTPMNNTSVILLSVLDGHKVLFSGDAGIPALTKAVDLANAAGIELTDLRFLHVPHHGSRHNLGNKLLKRIKTETAYISASKEAPKHPSKRITNALKKHGAKVFVTKGTDLCHRYNAPNREWGPATEEIFYERFEEV